MHVMWYMGDLGRKEQFVFGPGHAKPQIKLYSHVHNRSGLHAHRLELFVNPPHHGLDLLTRPRLVQLALAIPHQRSQRALPLHGLHHLPGKEPPHVTLKGPPHHVAVDRVARRVHLHVTQDALQGCILKFDGLETVANVLNTLGICGTSMKLTPQIERSAWDAVSLLLCYAQVPCARGNLAGPVAVPNICS